MKLNILGEKILLLGVELFLAYLALGVALFEECERRTLAAVHMLFVPSVEAMACKQAYRDHNDDDEYDETEYVVGT